MKSIQHREPWNKGKLVGQKPSLWAIRIQLQSAHQVRDLAMFNLAIDSRLRGCDLVNLRVLDIAHGNQILARAMVVQRKAQQPVQFESTEPTRAAVAAWIVKAKLKPEQCLFPGRISTSPHVSMDSTHGPSISGLQPSGLTRLFTAPAPCAGPRLR